MSSPLRSRNRSPDGQTDEPSTSFSSRLPVSVSLSFFNAWRQCFQSPYELREQARESHQWGLADTSRRGNPLAKALYYYTAVVERLGVNLNNWVEACNAVDKSWVRC